MIAQRSTLEREALLNLLRGTYRGARFKRRASRDVAQMDVTLSSELCILKAKSG